MSDYTKRLLIAAVLSVVGIASSIGWYRYMDPYRKHGNDSENQKAVARLETAKNEVQKRSVKRVIWQSVQENEQLYSGEAVRTTSDAEARIIFEKGTEIELDPDSVVIIEENNDKLNLDFVKGNLFVKGTGEDSNVSLKSGTTNISLNNADMSLGKDAGKNLDVQVLRGVAQLSSGDKTVTLDKEKSGTIGESGVMLEGVLKALSPQPNERKYVSISAPEAIVFKWNKLAADYNVHLEIGAKRESLKSETATVSGEVAQLSLKVKPGVQFWRLVAVNKKDPKQVLATMVNKVIVIANVPPKLLSPTAGAQVTPEATEQDDAQVIGFRWTNPSKLSKLQIEVAHDESFKNIVFNEAVSDTAGFQTLPVKDDGQYYWRIVGLREGSMSVSSDVQKFSLRAHAELISPNLTSPSADAKVPFENVTGDGVYVTWQPVPGIDKYHVVIEKDGVAAADSKVIDKEVSGITQIKLPTVNPGTYQWHVSSVDAKAKESKQSAPRKFTVENLPQVAWLDSAQNEKYQYVTPAPSLKVSWKQDPKVSGRDNFKGYRVTVTGGPESGFTKTFETKTSFQSLDLAADGVYHAVVEVVGTQGMVLARSVTRDFEVGMKPLLDGPKWMDRLPASIQAMSNGTVSFSWKAVEGAKSYDVSILDGSGHVVKKQHVSQTSNTLKNLLPGQYTVAVSAVDAFGRAGTLGETKKIVVPDTSDVKAPGFKKIRIK